MKISFRKLKEDDLSFLCEIRNMYAKEFLHDSRTFITNQVIRWFKEKKPDYYVILVDEKAAGYFRLNNYSPKNQNIYIGADLHPDYCGKGIAYKAYIMFMKFLFSNYSLHKITLEVLSSNTRAINLYKKLGFILEGVKRDEVKKENKFEDSIIMSILKQEFSQLYD